MAADQIADDDAALTLVAVFESNDDHSVTLQAAAPAVVAILLRDTSRGDELEVACHADVVVAFVAGWAVVACI